MIEHTDEFVDALEFKFPGYFFVFLFDWSSGHAKYPKEAANVNSMNLNFGGKQQILRETLIVEDFVYPANFPPNLPRLANGSFQAMVFMPSGPLLFTVQIYVKSLMLEKPRA